MSEQNNESPKQGSSLVPHRAGQIQPRSILEEACSQLPEKKREAIYEKAAEKAYDLRIENKRKEADYFLAKREIDDYFDRLEDVRSGTRKNRTVMQGDFKTATGNVRIRSSACFVATVVYGSEQSDAVRTLRDFRDTVLIRRSAGRAFIRWYYRNGPALSMFVSRHQNVRWLCRSVLDVAVGCIRLSVNKNRY